jgi:subtilisin family serine protease
MIKSVLILALVALAAAAPSNLAKTLSTKGSANIIIKMAARTAPVLKSLNAPLITDRATRLNTVASALKAHATESQKNVIAALAGVEHHVLWISNEVFVPAANAALVEKLAAIEGIAEIREEFVMHLDQPIDIKVIPKSEMNPLAELGIERIQAHLVWSQLGNNGAGAVVANIDTGVRGTHETLRNNFLGSYGWFDPGFSTQIPDDRNGHGTHTMGTIAGGLGIGVAPGAKWAACRGCATDSCAESDLTRCAQFFACPTLADGTGEDCTKAPHVVNNSWGGGQANPWYNDFIDAWHAAGIIPVFSNGNAGPECGSANSPADSLSGVIGVGASTFTDSLAEFSSVGPSVTGLIKPDIAAPGQNVRSAHHGSDNAYVEGSGTSMAAPHVTGVVGLMAAENPSVDIPYADVQKFLYQNTDRNLVETGKSCGGIPETTFPNNAFGWGRINAFKSLLAFQNSRRV